MAKLRILPPSRILPPQGDKKSFADQLLDNAVVIELFGFYLPLSY